MNSITKSTKRARNPHSPNNSQPSARPKMAPCVVEEVLDNKERWERLSTLKPTQPQKEKISAQKCLTCEGDMVVERNTHKLAYAICKTDNTLSIPCSTPACKGWLAPTLRSGARRTCMLCHHIYYRCECRQLHVVPTTNLKYKCRDCYEQVCDYPCRDS